MERRIDSEVIRKGYGNELLAFQQYHDWHYEPYDPTDGLTVREIKEALQNGQSSMSRRVNTGTSNGPSLVTPGREACAGSWPKAFKTRSQWVRGEDLRPEARPLAGRGRYADAKEDVRR